MGSIADFTSWYFVVCIHNAEIDWASFLFILPLLIRRNKFSKSFFLFSYSSTRYPKGVRDIDLELRSM